MLRTFFSALGLLLSALLLFCASFLFNVALDLDRDEGAYGTAAIAVTRELSRVWKLSAIERHYTTEAEQELSPVLDADLAELRQLGPLLHADEVRIEARWSRPLEGQGFSAAALADRLAALINRTAKVTFIGKFAGGVARVSAELKREAGSLKLQRLRIENRSNRRQPQQPERRVISHA